MCKGDCFHWSSGKCGSEQVRCGRISAPTRTAAGEPVVEPLDRAAGWVADWSSSLGNCVALSTKAGPELSWARGASAPQTGHRSAAGTCAAALATASEGSPEACGSLAPRLEMTRSCGFTPPAAAQCPERTNRQHTQHDGPGRAAGAAALLSPQSQRQRGGVPAGRRPRLCPGPPAQGLVSPGGVRPPQQDRQVCWPHPLLELRACGFRLPRREGRVCGCPGGQAAGQTWGRAALGARPEVASDRSSQEVGAEMLSHACRAALPAQPSTGA